MAAKTREEKRRRRVVPLVSKSKVRAILNYKNLRMGEDYTELLEDRLRNMIERDAAIIHPQKTVTREAVISCLAAQAALNHRSKNGRRG